MYVCTNYDWDEKYNLKRIHVYNITNLKNNNANLLFRNIAKSYIKNRREYLVRGTSIPSGKRVTSSMVRSTCRSNKGLEGVLVNRLTKIGQNKREVKLRADSILYRCHAKGKIVWQSIVEDSYSVKDDGIKVTVDSYVSEHGEEIRSLVAPMFHLTRVLYESLPDPELNEKDIEEKIELEIAEA